MCGVQRCQPAHISAGMALALWPPCKWQHVSPSFWCQQTANTSNLQSYIVQEGDDLLKFKAQHMQLHGTVVLSFNKPVISETLIDVSAPPAAIKKSGSKLHRINNSATLTAAGMELLSRRPQLSIGLPPRSVLTRATTKLSTCGTN